MTTNHLMVDIETMSTSHDAAILSIGAVLFNPNNEESWEDIASRTDDQFLRRISMESNEQAGRHISASTVAWWLTQSEEARKGLVTGSAYKLRVALREFYEFVTAASPRPTCIWAKDPDFDVVILRHAFEQLKLMWPFKYWDSRSVRTIQDMAWSYDDRPNFGHTAHTALEDAMAQALMVQAGYSRLGVPYE